MYRLMQDRLNKEIPISRQMGLKVEKANITEVVVSAPIAPNVNHQGTVFGGALASALLVSGWCLAEIRLREWGHQGHIVVMKSEIDYLCPVDSDFLATCRLNDEKKWEEFRRVLEQRKKARIWLESTILNKEGNPAVKLNGLFVALLS